MELEVERLRVKNFRKKIVFDSVNRGNICWLEKMNEKMIEKYFHPRRLWMNRVGIFLSMCFCYFLDCAFVEKIVMEEKITRMEMYLNRGGEKYYPVATVTYDDISIPYSSAFSREIFDGFDKLFEEYCRRCKMVYDDCYKIWERNYWLEDFVSGLLSQRKKACEEDEFMELE